MKAQSIYLKVVCRNDDLPQIIDDYSQQFNLSKADLEMCIREAKWIGKNPNSLKLQKVPIEEFEQTFEHGLKDITKLDDLNQVVDWENSSFFTQALRNQIKPDILILYQDLRLGSQYRNSSNAL